MLSDLHKEHIFRPFCFSLLASLTSSCFLVFHVVSTVSEPYWWTLFFSSTASRIQLNVLNSIYVILLFMQLVAKTRKGTTNNWWSWDRIKYRVSLVDQIDWEAWQVRLKTILEFLGEDKIDFISLWSERFAVWLGIGLVSLFFWVLDEWLIHYLWNIILFRDVMNFHLKIDKIKVTWNSKRSFKNTNGIIQAI